MIILILIFPVLSISFDCESEGSGAPEDTKSSNGSSEMIFDMKIPDGFKSVAVDESGIFKWVKGSAEIYVVVGDIFSKSGPVVFEALKKAAQKDKTVEEVKNLKIKGAKAALIKEKAPTDTNRLRSWRMIVVTGNQIVNVDFSSPAKEFKTYMKNFDEAVRSFKINSNSKKG